MRPEQVIEQAKKLGRNYNIHHTPPFAKFDYGNTVFLKKDISGTELMVIGVELKPGSLTYITSAGGDKYYHMEMELSHHPNPNSRMYPPQVQGFQQQ